MQIEASKPSESDTNQSTTIVVIDIIDGIINNVINNVVEQTGDKFVRISNGYDILNDELDDISNSMIEPQQEYTGVLSNDSSTTSINNALSLLRTLHLGKLHSKNNDTTSTTSNNNNENTSQNNHCTVETMNSPNDLVECNNELEFEETQNSSIMTPSVAQPTLPKIIPFTNTDTNDESTSRGKQLPIPPPGEELIIPPTATIAGGSNSKIFIEYIKENQNKKKLKDQKGLAGCSGLFCPNILFIWPLYRRGKDEIF